MSFSPPQSRSSPRTRAVIFDFFGTLTVAAPRAERYRGHERVAAELGVPTSAYASALAESWPERSTGAYGNLEQTMLRLAERSGSRPSDRAVAAALAVRREEQRELVRLRPEAHEVLEALARAGHPVGLVSDCTHELPEAWPGLPLAPFVTGPVFSVEVGTKKPDPAIFRLAAERLAVPPEACLYVGDGDSRELPGAAAVGMRPVRLLTADHADAHVIDPIEWEGPTITGLAEVPVMLTP